MKSAGETLLVIRFSAIGDVALTLPVLRTVLQTYPALSMVVLTRPFLHDLFAPLARVQLPEVDLRDTHRGISGLLALSRSLSRAHRPDRVVDLHDVLRSKVIRAALSLTGVPATHIRKDRAGRRRMTRRTHKDRRPVAHSTTVYAEAFARAGYPIEWDLQDIAPFSYTQFGLPPLPKQDLPRPWVGFGPFASKEEKMYPLDRMRALILEQAHRGGTVWLFGGPQDKAWFASVAEAHPHIHIAPIHPLRQEMALIETLDLMVSVDSANTHLARLVGTRTLSIWGPTHPDAGFRPLGSPEEDLIQVDPKDLPCRPCSVVRQNPCHRGDRACMHWLENAHIMERIAKAVEGA